MEQQYFPLAAAGRCSRVVAKYRISVAMGVASDHDHDIVVRACRRLGFRKILHRGYPLQLATYSDAWPDWQDFPT
jgi:hypothetical protein